MLLLGKRNRHKFLATRTLSRNAYLLVALWKWWFLMTYDKFDRCVSLLLIDKVCKVMNFVEHTRFGLAQTQVFLSSCLTDIRVVREKWKGKGYERSIVQFTIFTWQIPLHSWSLSLFVFMQLVNDEQLRLIVAFEVLRSLYRVSLS